MLQIKKLTIGVQPSDKMFRVQSSWGEVVDAINSSRARKPLSPDYFSGVSVSPRKDQFALKNEELGNLFALSAESVVFQKSTYGKSVGVNVDKFMDEFIFIWALVQKRLSITGIRRVGIVAEHRVSGLQDPSGFLAERLVRFKTGPRSAKFNLSFEVRSGVGGRPFAEGDAAFLNKIHTMYDSSLDSEAPEDGAVNFNLDVQRYYAPLIERGEVDEFKILRRTFEGAWREYQSELKDLGLVE